MGLAGLSSELLLQDYQKKMKLLWERIEQQQVNVVARKKDGTIRLSVDLSAPNKSVVPNYFPLPNTD